ncbi:MAG: M13 family metallopeptidase, partial [Acidobacteriaceae bacterium]|nr:M13 family metallopeptidase [Acidobacteriaceae bacterium]
LPKAFVDQNFEFYGKVLSGVQQIKPRWKRCVSATDDELGEALGRKYVEKTFGEQGKERTLQMVHEIEEQMVKDLESLTWMSPETKKQALIKLHAVANKIGYPDKWRDYSSVEIVNNDFFGNWYRANEFESKRQRDKIGKPVDRTEWEMTPPTVNAYYEPTENNINFPAGILQPPFYSNSANDAVNYGAVGTVIGHELTHGFDDQGSKFDADGNLRDWWQKSDRQSFDKLEDCFVNEYGSFEAVPGVELNGKLTLGENTADNGGIRLAYLALIDALSKKDIAPSVKQDAYTQPQQFFLGFAQIWCENTRPEEARLRAETDPHSPGKYRTNGVVRNMPEFDQAFGCKPDSTMYVAPGKGCRAW